MIFVGDGALLQQALTTAANRAYRIDGVFGNTDRVASFCRQRDIPFEPADRLHAEPERIRALCTDGIGFSIDNARIVPRPALELGVAFFGIHGGILPIQRGNPVVAAIFAILEGAEAYGASLFELDAGIDTGAVVAVQRFAVTPRSRLHELVMATALRCHSLFEEHLDAVVRGDAARLPPSTAPGRTWSLRDLRRLPDWV